LGGQVDVAGPVQFQHQAPGRHVARLSCTDSRNVVESSKTKGIQMTQSEVQGLLRAKHNELWGMLLGGDIKQSVVIADVYPLARISSEPNLMSRYEILKDTIHIVFIEDDLNDSFCLQPSAPSGQPAVWETELLHELVHEHRYKLIANPTDEGCASMAQDKTGFSDPGHDEWFYTAICACALRMGLSPEVFRQRI
jgi:hypothetical protein